ncbi:TRAP transporter small permease subunit, partial [Myxococcota bacterium]|nr:TRAP transporter small permease subunit [Myxococcota bacterium]
RMISAPARMRVGLITSVFTAVVCALLAWHSGRFVLDEYTYGSAAFSDIPAGILQVGIPVGFGLIAIRYGLRVRQGLVGLISGEVPEDPVGGENPDEGAS